MKHLIQYIVVLSGIVALVSCGGKSQPPMPPQQRALPIPVFTVPVRSVTGYDTYPARLEGIVNSQVRAKVPGYITRVLVDEGQRVRKGQLLFKLETHSLTQDADAAQANVNAAQVEVDKLKPLVEKKIISSVQLETAKAKLQQAKSAYNSIIANIGYADIRSPVDGFAGAIRFREGALVSPGDPQPLTTVADISSVYAYFSMNEEEYLDFIQNAKGKTRAEKIKNMPPVQLILANGSLYDEKGEIETINSQVNTSTGSISFRATFPNPNLLLTSGNSGTIKIPHNYDSAVVIPQRVTYEQQGRTYVYKVVKDSTTRVVATQIEIKAPIDNLYVVSSGLTKGEVVVADGIDKLRNDMPIVAEETPYDSIAKPLEKVFR